MGRKRKVLSDTNTSNIETDKTGDNKFSGIADTGGRKCRAAKSGALESFRQEVGHRKRKKKEKKLIVPKEENVDLVEKEDVSINVEESSDEEIVNSVRKRKPKVFSSDEESEQDHMQNKREGGGKKARRCLIESEDEQDQKISDHDKENTPDECYREKDSQRKVRIQRVLDSSDEESSSAQTPNQKKKKKLERMVESINKKKRRKFDFVEEEASSEHSSDVDEENLPMFEHEEFPPESEEDKVDTTEENEEASIEDDDFIDDEEILDEESGEDGEDEEETAESDDNLQEPQTDSDSDQYTNPYLESGRSGGFSVTEELAKISKSLSRTTKEDKDNKKRYKAEMGKYQLQVRSEKNKAAAVDEKTRYKRNMKVAKFDAGLKEMRNLEKDDEDFFEKQEANLFGTQAQIFPHTKKRSPFNGNCEVTGCGYELIKNVSKVVGAKFLDPFNAMFMKKKNRFDKESYYWICRSHMLSDAKSSDSESESD